MSRRKSKPTAGPQPTERITDLDETTFIFKAPRQTVPDREPGRRPRADFVFRTGADVERERLG